MCQLLLCSPCLLFGSFAAEQIGRLVWKPPIHSKCDAHWLVEETQLFSEGCDVAETNPYLGRMKPGSIVVAGICVCWGEPSGFWSFELVKCRDVGFGCPCCSGVWLHSSAAPLLRCSTVHRQPLTGLVHRKWWLLGVERIKRKVLKCHRVQERLQIGVFWESIWMLGPVFLQLRIINTHQLAEASHTAAGRKEAEGPGGQIWTFALRPNYCRSLG